MDIHHTNDAISGSLGNKRVIALSSLKDRWRTSKEAVGAAIAERAAAQKAAASSEKTAVPDTDATVIDDDDRSLVCTLNDKIGELTAELDALRNFKKEAQEEAQANKAMITRLTKRNDEQSLTIDAQTVQLQALEKLFYEMNENDRQAQTISANSDTVDNEDDDVPPLTDGEGVHEGFLPTDEVVVDEVAMSVASSYADEESDCCSPTRTEMKSKFSSPVSVRSLRQVVSRKSWRRKKDIKNDAGATDLSLEEKSSVDEKVPSFDTSDHSSDDDDHTPVENVDELDEEAPEESDLIGEYSA